MKYFYVITNAGKKNALETEGYVKEYLERRGAVCLSAREGKTDGSGRYVDKTKVPRQTQCVITIGGDGTLIQAARDLAGRGLPLIGINRGHLGYLTQVSHEEDILPVLDALLEDRFRMEIRMMLQGDIMRDGQQIATDIALNEIVLTRKDVLRMLRFKLYVNEEYLNEYTADGMIIATPTGSTAYNLSAGGPIVTPNAQMMVVTPICSHALNARSIVLSSEDRIRIEIGGGGQMIVYDGDTTQDLMEGDSICIRRSGIQTMFIKLKQISFLENLSNKMAGI